MIIWAGFGFLVPVIVFAFSLLTEALTRTITQDVTYYQTHSWPLMCALVTSSVTLYFLGKWLRTRKAKVFIEKETGNEVMFKKDHSFFFIPMDYWGIIIFIITVYLGVKELFVKV